MSRDLCRKILDKACSSGKIRDEGLIMIISRLIRTRSERYTALPKKNTRDDNNDFSHLSHNLCDSRRKKSQPKMFSCDSSRGASEVLSTSQHTLEDYWNTNEDLHSCAVRRMAAYGDVNVYISKFIRTFMQLDFHSSTQFCRIISSARSEDFCKIIFAREISRNFFSSVMKRPEKPFCKLD